MKSERTERYEGRARRAISRALRRRIPSLGSAGVPPSPTSPPLEIPPPGFIAPPSPQPQQEAA